MNFQEFANEVKKELDGIVKDRFTDAMVVLRTVRKNNNIKRDAISIVRKEEMATPTIYLMDYYSEYQRGRDVKDICQDIFHVYTEGIKNVNARIDIRKFTDFDSVKDVIMYRLVNYEMNKDMLKEHPHYKFLDMAIVFFVLIDADSEGICTALISNVHMENWNVTSEDIRTIAFNNTWKKYPPIIRRMEDVVSELIVGDILDDDPEDLLEEDICYGGFTYGEMKVKVCEELSQLQEDELQMYVLTNSIRCNGAACITYPNVLKDFAEKVGKDLYVIPSSIHEVIIIPKTKEEKEKYDEMVKEVNSNELDPIEILSNHAYIYRRDINQLEC